MDGRMTIRIGLPKLGTALIHEAFALTGPAGDADVGLLVSANALWDHKDRRFRLPEERRLKDGTITGYHGEASTHRRMALDSAGFVAMRLYGGKYPWTVEQYVRLGADSQGPGAPWGNHGWEWYSAMDLCCEPEIAHDAREVRRRVEGTAQLLDDMLATVTSWQEVEGAWWFRDPMPVLQGWTPEDYALSARLLGEVLEANGRPWPALVGVGSVCRRQVNGPAGLLAVLASLDRVLPPGVRLHLFGVKGTALGQLRAHPRAASMDSCAWDFGARIAARKAGISNTNDHRAQAMRQWLGTQLDRWESAAAPAQLDLWRD